MAHGNAAGKIRITTNNGHGNARHKNMRNKEIKMAIDVNWGMMGLFSVIAFLVGWFIFGLLGAVVLAIIVMVIMGIIQFR
jgi:cytochrome c oxidase subunit IV